MMMKMTPASELDIEYSPYDDATQMFRQIADYPPSFSRLPSSAPIPRPLTLSERTGPIELARRWNVGPLDLSRAMAGGPRAIGQLLHVTGRITDEDGSPVSGVVIEIWQANSAGKYVHEMDDHIAPIDP